MIEINKAEASYVREHGATYMKEHGFNGVTRVMRQDSKRKHFYLCEDDFLVGLLNEYRKSLNIVESSGINN